MSWSIGYDSNWQRDIGYGVPAYCDHPQCWAEIDRGLAHVCGAGPYGGEKGCGLFFCGHHLTGGDQKCPRCQNYKKPYCAKPDKREWVQHKLTDESWAQWRSENSQQVEKLNT